VWLRSSWTTTLLWHWACLQSDYQLPISVVGTVIRVKLRLNSMLWIADSAYFLYGLSHPFRVTLHCPYSLMPVPNTVHELALKAHGTLVLPTLCSTNFARVSWLVNQYLVTSLADATRFAPSRTTICITNAADHWVGFSSPKGYVNRIISLRISNPDPIIYWGMVG